MDQTINFGMNHFQNQINNANRFNNPMLNQYNQINPLMNQMTFIQENPLLNQMNTFNQSNLMMNQTTNYNQDNSLCNQLNTLLNQMDIILNQVSTILNQMNSYEQNNLMMNMNINFINQMMNETNQKMKEINQKMKQINEINQKKIIKEMIQNINLNNLNKDQMELINSIIQFYKENGNEYMSFDYPYQIKNIIYILSLKYYKLDISDNIEDPLYYIKEPKKIIRFINSNYKEYKVNIPLTITKYDLYSIAQKYKCFHNNDKHLSGNHFNIMLINNNLILNRDETSIECINNNNIIIIIEPRNFPDNSYYNILKERTKEKGYIKFQFSSGKKIGRMFPDDVKIYEIYKSINLEIGLDINTYQILANGTFLKINDQKKGSFLFNLPTIYIDEREIFYRNRFGKIVNVAIKYNNKIQITKKLIGLLNSIKELIEEIQNLIEPKKLRKIKIENEVIKKDDIRSLLALGIKNDFICYVELED